MQICTLIEIGEIGEELVSVHFSSRNRRFPTVMPKMNCHQFSYDDPALTRELIRKSVPVHFSEVAPAQRWLVTPTCRHISSTGQVEHFGRIPVQMCLPKGTKSRLISTQ